MLPLVRFRSLSAINHGIGTRHGGVSQAPFATLNMSFAVSDALENVVANRRRFLRAFGVPAGNSVSGWLTHGNEVSVFRAGRPAEHPVIHERMRSDSEHVEPLFPSDGVVSDVPDLHFVLTFADCVPVLFFDPVRGAIGAAHAGWRGTAGAIGARVVESMQSHFGSRPSDLLAAVGPSVGPCCYSIGPEVLSGFRAHGNAPVVSEKDGRTHLDLWATNERQLQAAGIPVEQIENPRLCTACHTDTFFSHRGEAGRTGRFAACIGLAPPAHD